MGSSVRLLPLHCGPAGPLPCQGSELLVLFVFCRKVLSGLLAAAEVQVGCSESKCAAPAASLCSFCCSAPSQLPHFGATGQMDREHLHAVQDHLCPEELLPLALS